MSLSRKRDITLNIVRSLNDTPIYGAADEATPGKVEKEGGSMQKKMKKGVDKKGRV